MLEYFPRLLMGYADFEIKGDSSRFINMAVKSGINLWGFQKKTDCFCAKIKARDYKKLRAIQKRCGVKMRVAGKHGLTFQTHKLGRRKGLVVGAAFMLCIYALLSSCIWDVQVMGNDRLTNAQVLSAAGARGVFAGAGKNSFQPEQVSKQLMMDLQDVSWISVNTDGSTVQIVLKEIEEKPEPASGEAPSDIVAKREGKILSITAESGMAQVKVGDMVTAEQVLIAGMYKERTGEYNAKPETSPIKTFLVAARGEIVAETVREFVVEVPLYVEEETVRKAHTNRYLNFFGLQIPLGLQSAAVGDYHLYEERNRLILLDQPMPVEITRKNYVFYEVQERPLSREEMKKQGIYRLRQLQAGKLGKEAKITEETLDYQFAEGKLVLTATCRCEEKIGINKEILFEYPKN